MTNREVLKVLKRVRNNMDPHDRSRRAIESAIDTVKIRDTIECWERDHQKLTLLEWELCDHMLNNYEGRFKNVLENELETGEITKDDYNTFIERFYSMRNKITRVFKTYADHF